MPDLGRTVRQRPLASTAGDGDCYSLGYSPVVHARVTAHVALAEQGASIRATAHTGLGLRRAAYPLVHFRPTLSVRVSLTTFPRWVYQ